MNGRLFPERIVLVEVDFLCALVDCELKTVSLGLDTTGGRGVYGSSRSLEPGLGLGSPVRDTGEFIVSSSRAMSLNSVPVAEAIVSTSRSLPAKSIMSGECKESNGLFFGSRVMGEFAVAIILERERMSHRLKARRFHRWLLKRKSSSH